MIKTKGDFANIPEDICRLLPETHEALGNFYQVQDTLNYTREQLNGYFYKYFPRSYTETFDITAGLFGCSENYRTVFSAKRHLTILDIGSGIGGNMVGLLKYISTAFPRVQTVEIDSVDGNERALDYQAYILKNIELDFSVTFNPVHHVFSPETLIEELSALDLKNKAYDIVMESKFINEFYRKKTDIQGLYAQFIGYGGDLLKQDGILMITELTDPLPGRGYFNRVFNRETRAYYKDCSTPLNQIFPIQCHLWRDCCEDGDQCFVQQRYLSGKAKVFTQIFCRQSLGRIFYGEKYLNEQKQAPIRIKETGCYGGYYCFQGKLSDTADRS